MNSKLFQPIIRFIAIAINILVSDLVLIAIFGLSGHAINDDRMELAVLLTLVLWFVVLEPVLLATWGTTPAGWLLKIKIKNSEGKKLNYSQALARSVLVLLFGLGYAAVPLAALVFIYANLESYISLSSLLLLLAFGTGNYIYFLRHNNFYWDKWLNINTSQEAPGWLRLTVGVVIVLYFYIGGLIQIIATGQKQNNLRVWPVNARNITIPEHNYYFEHGGYQKKK